MNFFHWFWNLNPDEKIFLEDSLVRFWLLSGERRKKFWIEVLASKTNLPDVQSGATRVGSKSIESSYRGIYLGSYYC